MSLTLPPLPYALDALEPHISRRTLATHHGRHHAAYVEKTRALVQRTAMEEATLEEIISRVRATGLVNEIVVVDDSSSDNSPAILRRLQNGALPPLRLLRHERNQGKGAAIRTGRAHRTTSWAGRHASHLLA